MHDARLASVVGESLRSASARPVRLTVMALVAALALGATFLMEANEVHNVRAAIESATRGGVGVLIVDNNGETFPGDGCSRATRSSDVIAAGEIYHVQTSRSEAVPTALFQVATVSAGYLRVIDPNFSPAAPGAFVLGTEVPSALGLTVGSRLKMVDERAGVVGDVEHGVPRVPEQSRWIYRTDVRGEQAPILECWVEVGLDDVDSFTRVVPSLFAEADKVRVRHLTSSDALTVSVQRFRDRPSRFGWLVAGVLLGFLAGIGSLMRRSEYALYRLSGFSRNDVSLIAYVDYWVMAGLASVVGGICIRLVSLLMGVIDAGGLAAGTVAWAQALCLGAVVALLAAQLALSGDVSRAMRNRD